MQHVSVLPEKQTMIHRSWHCPEGADVFVPYLDTSLFSAGWLIIMILIFASCSFLHTKSAHTLPRTPAVMDWAKQNGRKHFVDPDNEGVVIVHVTPQDRYT